MQYAAYTAIIIPPPFFQRAVEVTRKMGQTNRGVLPWRTSLMKHASTERRA